KTGHLERRAALTETRARPSAARIERVHVLIALRELKAQFVDDAFRWHRGVRCSQHVVLGIQDGTPALRRGPTPGLNVLVERVGVVKTRVQALRPPDLMVDLREELVPPDGVRHVTGLDRKPGAPQDLRRRAERTVEQRHDVRIVDGDEVVRTYIESLERREEEALVPFQRPAERAAELLLAVGRLLTID